MLSVCIGQISVSLVLEPFSANISLDVTGEAADSVASMYPHLLLSLYPSTQRTLQTAQEATISPESERSAKGFWLFNGIFLLYGLCVH